MEQRTVQLSVADGMAFAEFKARLAGFARGVQAGIDAAIQVRTEQLVNMTELRDNKPAPDIGEAVVHRNASDEQALRESADSGTED